MVKVMKWLPRLSRSPQKKASQVQLEELKFPTDHAEEEDELSTVQCDSDCSNSMIEKTYIQHCVASGMDFEHASNDVHDLHHQGESIAEFGDFRTIATNQSNNNSATVEARRTQRATSPRIKHVEPSAGADYAGASPSSPKSPTSRHRSRLPSPAMESFECIYREDGVEPPAFIQEELPLLATSNSLRGDGSPNHCQCSGNRRQLPHLHPSLWPQPPILLRPKPYGSTRVRGIRKEGSMNYLWKPGQTKPWWEVLQNEWGTTAPAPATEQKPATTPEFCEFCIILPINNGCEHEKESLVVDFDTPVFEGTLLFRIRGAAGTTQEPYQDNKGYFSDKIIRYQAVLRGQFKTSVAFSDLQTGIRLDRPCGKLPPKWVMWTAMKVIHFFAPQLQTQMEKVDKPYVMSPLGSAPRTIIVEDETADPDNSNGTTLSREPFEPIEAPLSLLGRNNPVENPLERARARKRQLDQWFMAKSEMPRACIDKIYTFEFLQHLFDYHNFSIDLGNSFQVKVKDILDGQPLQLMAEYRGEGQEAEDSDNNLWAFEIWNECLWEDAKASLAAAAAAERNTNS